MALRDYKYDEFPNEQAYPEPAASYQDYQTDDDTSSQLNDLLFFVNVAIFAIASVLAVFILSALNVHSLVAFALAIPLGILGLKGFHLFRYYQKKHRQN